MSKRQDELDRLQVTSPCSTSWERMSGDERKRYCDECQRFVYDFSRMTSRQIEAMIAASRGRLCARLTRKEDGSLVTLEIPLIAHPANRRKLPVAGAVMTAILSVNAAGLPQPLASLASWPSANARQEAGQDTKKGDQKAQLEAATATLIGNVLDPMGAVVAGAKITLVNDETKEARGNVSSSEGEYQFAQLLSGIYTLEVAAPGFTTTKIVGIEIQSGKEHRANATLGASGEQVTMGVVASSPLPLRKLYQESELTAVVMVGESVRVESDEDEGESDERDVKQVKTWLYISTLLRGESPGQVIEVYRRVRPGAPDDFAWGNKLLVFLNRRRSDDQKELLDGYDGDFEAYRIKKLSKEELESYLRRIKELDALLRQENLERAEMIEWLVRCAEDPATRWEGASELAGNIKQLCKLDAKDSQSADGKEDEKKTEALVRAALLERPGGESQADVTEGEAKKIEDLRLATLLTKAQKDRLLTALYKTAELRGNDMELIELAKDWKDARLAPFLFTQLRRLETSAPPLATALIETLADMLNDEEITALAEDYMNNLDYDDLLDEAGNLRLEDDKRALTEAGAAAIAARRERLQKFIFTVQSRISLLDR